MTNNQKEIMTELQKINERLKLIQKERQRLEELYKEGTDEGAIEAGKLLVKEILFNTDDRTDLIEEMKS